MWKRGEQVDAEPLGKRGVLDAFAAAQAEKHELTAGLPLRQTLLVAARVTRGANAAHVGVRPLLVTPAHS